MAWTITHYSDPIYKDGSVVGRKALDGSFYATYCDGDGRWFCKTSLTSQKPYIEGPFKSRTGAAKRAARNLYYELARKGLLNRRMA